MLTITNEAWELTAMAVEASHTRLFELVKLIFVHEFSNGHQKMSAQSDEALPVYAILRVSCKHITDHFRADPTWKNTSKG